MQTESSILPVAGSDPVEIIVNDHVTIKALLDQLVGATAATEQQSTLEQLKGVLTLHNATEENLIYPALRKIAGKRWEAGRLYHETAEADVLVFELDQLLKHGQNDEAGEKAKKLRGAILEHIDDEEQKALPDLRDNSTHEQAQAMVAEIHKFRSALTFEPARAKGVPTSA